jgi:hypothetical protein
MFICAAILVPAFVPHFVSALADSLFQRRFHVQHLLERDTTIHRSPTACVWVTACIGAACAIAQWRIALGVVLLLVVLVLGGPFEKAIHRRWPGQRPVGVDEKAPDRARVPGAEM